MACKIECARCHGQKSRRKEAIPKNRKTYICRSCRYAILATKHLDAIITRTKSFRSLRATILSEVKKYERGDASSSERQATFLKNIKSIMDQHFVRDYSFNVIDNRLISIEIQNLPVLGSLSISIYEPKK